jgi:hypothetical protein
MSNDVDFSHLPPDIREKIRQADAKLRKRARLDKRERRQLRRRAGGPCKATTKQGRPCRGKAWANGYCGVHGGLNAMQYQQLLKQRRAKRVARRQCA